MNSSRRQEFLVLWRELKAEAAIKTGDWIYVDALETEENTGVDINSKLAVTQAIKLRDGQAA